MSTKPKLKTFNVMIKATIDFNVELKADSLIDALTLANATKHYDFLPEIAGGYNDYEIEITGIWK